MFNLDKAKGTVEMRHYAVRATPTGITKAIKKVIYQFKQFRFGHGQYNI